MMIRLKKTVPYILFMGQSIAQANASDVYPHLFIGAKGGYQLSTHDSFDNTMKKQPIFGAFVGSQYTEHWSWDVGYQYHDASSEEINNTETGILTTALRYDWYPLKNVSLYARAGAAYWSIDTETQSTDYLTESGLSPLGEIGISYRITPKIYLNTSYTMINNIRDQSIGEYDSQAVMFGITYHFKGKELIETPKEAQPPKTIEKVDVIKLFETKLQGDVEFAFNSFKFNVTSETKDTLNEFIKILKQHPNAKAEITGHTDSIGSYIYNQELSEKRAYSVFEYLKQKGINNNQITVLGKGETLPISTNMHKQGRAENRRVELVILTFEYRDKT